MEDKKISLSCNKSDERNEQMVHLSSFNRVDIEFI